MTLYRHNRRCASTASALPRGTGLKHQAAVQLFFRRRHEARPGNEAPKHDSRAVDGSGCSLMGGGGSPTGGGGSPPPEGPLTATNALMLPEFVELGRPGGAEGPIVPA